MTMTEYWLVQIGTSWARPSYQRWVWRRCSRINRRFTRRKAIVYREGLEGRGFLIERNTRVHTESWCSAYNPHEVKRDKKVGEGSFQKYHAAPLSGRWGTRTRSGPRAAINPVSAALAMSAMMKDLFRDRLSSVGCMGSASSIRSRDRVP
jgi:hypothetical protein